MVDLSRRQRLLVLGTCCMSLFIVGLDNTIVNVALPSIGHELHAPTSGLQWTIDAYTLVLASLLMLSGSTADRLGRKRTFIAGLLLFSLGSLLCSLAPSLGWLVAFRALQAIGGSMLNPVAMSIIVNTFTDPRERARAIGVWGAVIGFSMALGPVIGGVLVEGVGWRSVFWINLPVGALAIVLTLRFVQESRAPRARRLDPVGQVLIIAFLASLTYAIIEGARLGWASPTILGLFVVAALALAGTVGYELRRPEPLLDVRLFRSPPFAGATLIAVCAFASLGGFLFLNTLYLQDVRGFSALHAGLYTLPMAAMTVVWPPVSGYLVGQRGPRISLFIAGVALTGASVLLLGLTSTTSTGRLLLTYLLFGFGFGWVNAPITNAAVSGLPKEQAGVASAVASTSRQVGQSLGVAVIGVAATAAVHGSFQSGFAAATHVGWFITLGLGIAILILGQVTTGRRQDATGVTAVEAAQLRAPVADGNASVTAR
jgi:EmrB/QacA subfamily drug resistance transporter